MIKTDSLLITPDILSLITKIDEFKGAWRAFGRLAPERLASLRRVATIESIGSSTRIEGSRLTDQQVERLLANLKIQSFDTRDEQEVAGYAKVMDLIFSEFDYIPISENYIKQLHALLLEYSDKDDWHKGNYKTTSNSVAAFDEMGRRIAVVFETATPFDTPHLMLELITWYQDSIKEAILHPLLIVGIFIVTFLEIHPFQDGNGRLSRVLTTLLLLKSGYSYVPYSSIESIIEQNKQGYYLALRQTQGTIRTESPNWQPWLVFFLQTLYAHMKRLEAKVFNERLLLTQLPELSLKILELTKERGTSSRSDIAILLGANENTVKLHLRKLVEAKYLVKQGTGKNTFYQLAEIE